MKDYSRKPYTNYQYRDWMKNVTSKSVFNQILEQHSGFGEFSNNRASKTSLDRAVSHFLRQSEFKKPYNSPDFKEMEEDWEGPPGFRLNNRFDQPWNMQPPWVPGPSAEPTTTIFDAEVEGGWCEDSTKNITITGTHPIYEIVITWGDGASLSNIIGYGFNEVTCDLEVGEYSGFVTIEVIMTSSEGVEGDSNVNVFEDNECCMYDEPFNLYGNKGTSLRNNGQTWAESGQSPGSWADNDFAPYVHLVSGKLDTVDPFYDAARTRWMWYINRGEGPAITTAKYRMLLYNSKAFRYNLETEVWDVAEQMDMVIARFTDGFNPTVDNFNDFAEALTNVVTPPLVVESEGDDPQWIEWEFNSAGLDYINDIAGEPNAWRKMIVMANADFTDAEPDGSYSGVVEGYDYHEPLAIRPRMLVEC
jgi:hypothetical protein